jgi:hypothetical protein
MRYLLRVLLIGCAAMLTHDACLGDSLSLSVVQDPGSHADLSALMAGESVTFDVNLSGLDVADGQTLGSLEGTVVFDGSLLGEPVSISPGSIVDPTGFSPASNPGLADGSYYFGYSDSGDLIAANGTLYSFTVVVQPSVTGSGILSLDPANGGYVAAYDADLNPVTIGTGSDLPFAVVGGAAIPEPSTLVMAGTALITVLARRRRNRK